jgi:hypothetical protein
VEGVRWWIHSGWRTRVPGAVHKAAYAGTRPPTWPSDRGDRAMISGEVCSVSHSVLRPRCAYDVRAARLRASRSPHTSRWPDRPWRDAPPLSELACALPERRGLPTARTPTRPLRSPAWRLRRRSPRAAAWDLAPREQQSSAAAVGEDPHMPVPIWASATVLTGPSSRENDWRAYATAAVRGRTNWNPREQELTRALPT